MMRLLAMEGRVELSRLRHGNRDDEDWAHVSGATGRIIERQRGASMWSMRSENSSADDNSLFKTDNVGQGSGGVLFS